MAHGVYGTFEPPLVDVPLDDEVECEPAMEPVLRVGALSVLERDCDRSLWPVLALALALTLVSMVIVLGARASYFACVVAMALLTMPVARAQ